ncbi:ABC transporter permease [Rodentibacter genomosp. 2]|uniref:ABC transporter n=1 Tax=Rodentibacter genomosp. 2 TaxID=1908266 RepID=A0A1V3JJM7_9PAST|nr:ABC transporter permease [Rodentibacter genomosp. 2]OOF56808.1 ABC transporter [Rodentibacter genomosp. 2]
MKASYLLNKSLSLKLALLSLIVFLSIVVGTVLSLIMKLDTYFFQKILFDPELHFALRMSLGTSILSLLLALCLAIPSAWVMSQVRLPFQKIFDTLLDLPMVLPPLVTGLSLLLLFNSQGILSQLIPSIGKWIFSPIGIIVAQTYIASAILFRSATGIFSVFDPGYRLASYNLGLSPFQTLLKIELPMCWKPLLAGAILAWSRAIGEFGATLMLAGATRFKTETLPMAVYLNIASGDFEIAIGASLWLLFISACLLSVLRIMNRKYEDVTN